MKAAVLEQVNKLVVRDIPSPKPATDEVVIQVKTCGMCGTDLKLYTGQYTARVPVVPGHEYAGEIVEVGKNVKNLRPGQRVVSDPNESCGKCYWCRNHQPCFCHDLAAYGVLRDGGFAEYCTATEKGVYAIPEAVEDEVAAFAEPVSCVVHAADRIQYRHGETVAILGGGPLGQIHLQFALNAGAIKAVLVDPNRTRRDLATRFGARAVIDPKDGNVRERLMEETGGLGADVVIECVGRKQTIEESFRLAKRGGRVVIFGFAPEKERVEFSPFDVLSRELTILGAWVNPYSYSRALEVLSSGRIEVKPLISHRLTLDNILQGYHMMAQKQDGFIKSLVSP